MLEAFQNLLLTVSGGASRDESDAWKFLACLFCTVCSGVGCLVFLIIAAHGVYVGGTIFTVAHDLKIAAVLAILGTVFGLFTGRWFRDEPPKNLRH